ncbi:MAG: CpaF family protein [Nevskiaceae bacterium]|nr:MAG: CpaF family protein [Nevskiaceae bacterium]TBR72057.1 MAG: CpaF family protein [Nevskiaceae bacterium]
MDAAPDNIARFKLSAQYQALKQRAHRYIIDQIDQQDLDIEPWPEAKVERFVSESVRRYASENRLPLSRVELDVLARDACDELLGLGPLQPLVNDPEISDIVVNGPENVFVEKHGLMSRVPVRFNDNNHVLRVIQRILAPLGRRVDESTPMVDARLADGSRVNAVVPPIALDGPSISIRKFRAQPLTDEDLLRYGSVSQAELDYLRAQVESRKNILVLGGTGSGKTTFLNLISQWVPVNERIITVEDAAELRLRHEHIVRLETRPPNLEGQRAVTTRDLIRNALRMRPDRIIVGEVRGDEVLDMLQAMNTGHDGSMTTIHANSPPDAVHRLQLLCGFAGFKGSDATLLGQVSSAINLFVHVTRLANGKRRLMSICEIGGVAGNELEMRELFRYDVAADRHVDERSS